VEGSFSHDGCSMALHVTTKLPTYFLKNALNDYSLHTMNGRPLIAKNQVGSQGSLPGIFNG
jgi:hypothetical protein